ncbi:MAG: class I SAM-dependent methyltransferase [Candidatus Saccharibacteria bacterium]
MAGIEKERINHRAHKYFEAQAHNHHKKTNNNQVHDRHLSVLTEISFYRYEAVLDVGCGTGSLLLRIPGRKGLALAGVDFSPKMLDIAREQVGHKADLRHGDSGSLPWEDDCFDMVLCADSFHYYPRPQAVLSEMRRVLKPKGRLIIAEPWFVWPLRKLINLLLPLDHSGRIKIYSEEEFAAMLTEAGFESVKWREASKNACVVSAQCIK